MGVKFNPFIGNLDLVDSPNGEFDSIDLSGDITLDDGGTYTTTVQTVTPTANRTISFPDATGTVALVAGSSGQVTYNNAGAQAGLTSASIGSTDEINISLAGAASTPPVSFTGSWFTGGTSTTTKPQLLIEPTGTTSTAWSTDGTGFGVNAASGFAGRLLDLQTNGTSQVVVQGDGNVGLGTSSPDYNLEIAGTSNVYTRIKNNSNNAILFGVESAEPVIYGATTSGSALPIVFKTGTTERARIDSSGRLLVGTSTALNIETGLTVTAQQTNGGAGIAHIRNSSSSGADGSPCLVLSKTSTTTSSGARFIQFSADNDAVPMGGIVGNGASNVQFASISDIRDKENIQPLTGALDKVKQLEVVSYDWKRNKEHVNAGFIAQNVETVFPEYVIENIVPEAAEPRKGVTGGLSSGYIAVLTAALQEAIAKIETLEAKVVALEAS